MILRNVCIAQLFGLPVGTYNDAQDTLQRPQGKATICKPWTAEEHCCHPQL